MVFPLGNHRWMCNSINPNTRTIIDEFIFRVEKFVNYVCQSLIYTSEGIIWCPYLKCCSGKLLKLEIVRVHLYKKGFKPDFWIWTNHGEEIFDQMSVDCVRVDDPPMCSEVEDVVSRYQHIGHDTARMDYDNSRGHFEPSFHFRLMLFIFPTMLLDIFLWSIYYGLFCIMTHDNIK